MPELFRAELTLPNQTAALAVAQSYLTELMTLARLTEDESRPMIDAAREACANVIDHAFEPDEQGTFTVVGEITHSELTIAVQDTGTPFDPTGKPMRTTKHREVP